MILFGGTVHIVAGKYRMIVSGYWRERNSAILKTLVEDKYRRAVTEEFEILEFALNYIT